MSFYKQYTVGFALVSKEEDAKVVTAALYENDANRVLTASLNEGAGALLRALRPNKFNLDTLVEDGTKVQILTPSLVRTAFTMAELLEAVAAFDARGIALRTLDGSFDSTDDLRNLKCLLKFEKFLEEKRENTAQNNSTPSGARTPTGSLLIGPRPHFSKDDLLQLREEYRSGKSPRKLAEKWGVSRSTVTRALGLYGAGVYFTSDEWEAARRKALSGFAPKA